MRAELVERAEGNPLFVEQMLALLREAPDAGERVAIPPTIQALLAARLDRLPLAELRGDRRRVGGRAGVLAASGRGAGGQAPEPQTPRRCSMRSARKELIDGRTASTLDRRGGLRLPPRADPRRRLRVAHEADAGGAARALRGLARGAPPATRLIELEAILGYHLEQAYRYRVELAPEDERARGARAAGGRTRLAAAGRRAARAREDATAAEPARARRASCCRPARPSGSSCCR